MGIDLSKRNLVLLLFLLLGCWLLAGGVAMAIEGDWPADMLEPGQSSGTVVTQPVSSSVQAGSYQLLVSKQYLLSADYLPDDLVLVADYARSATGIKIRKVAGEALGKMLADMKKAGISDIFVNSAYRDYNKQKNLYTNKVATYTSQGYSTEKAAALAGQWVAEPGTSEHQTGLAVDFSTSTLRYGLNNSFATTTAGKWLKENCWKYGFILRYPNDKTDITGYAWESWHFRYVGAPHAEYIMKNQLTLDEYQSALRQNGYLAYAASGQVYAVYYSWSDSGNLFGDTLLQLSLARAGQGDYLLTTVQPEGALLDIAGHWGEAYIRQLAETGIIMGYTDHTFRPNANISKAELTTMLARLLQLLENPAAITYDVTGQVVFTDCGESDYYYQAIWICYAAGLLDASLYQDNGDGTALFLPGEIMRRKQVAMMLAGLFSQEELEKEQHQAQSQPAFPDLAGLEEQVVEDINILATKGILTGDGAGNFNPESNITRAEICTIFSRILADFNVGGESAVPGDAQN